MNNLVTVIARRDGSIQIDRTSPLYDADMEDVDRVGTCASCMGDRAVHPVPLVSLYVPTPCCWKHR